MHTDIKVDNSLLEGSLENESFLEKTINDNDNSQNISNISEESFEKKYTTGSSKELNNQISTTDNLNTTINNKLEDYNYNLKENISETTLKVICDKNLKTSSENLFINTFENVKALNENSSILLKNKVDDSYINKNIFNNNSGNNSALGETLQVSNSNYIDYIINERSPDLFEDEDIDNVEQQQENNKNNFQNILNISNEISIEDNSEKNSWLKNEQELLNRIQKCLSGVPPPPSVTIIQMDLMTAVINRKNEIFDFYKTYKDERCNENFISLLKPTHSFEQIKEMKWPEILNSNHFGLCYNSSIISEQIELNNMAVTERFIGVETSSSFTRDYSQFKTKKYIKKDLLQSPGTRLSHLAKRRAVFSSANLQNSAKLKNRQIELNPSKLMNRRKLKSLTPKRIEAGKTVIVRRSPTSAEKKINLVKIMANKKKPSRETSKRALFRSPAKQKLIIKPEIADKVEKSKRALFSSENSSSDTFINDRYNNSSANSQILLKRKRVSDDFTSNQSKIFRKDSIDAENLTPRSMKFKSQSFCASTVVRDTLGSLNGKSLFRASSDTSFCSGSLSESHKKKILWAVSQSLQSKHIGVNHPNFKEFASVLARVVKRIFLLTTQKTGSTSDQMLKLAKRHVFAVTQGKTADEIYLIEKERLMRDKITTKFTGYIGPETYANWKNLLQRSTSNLSENSIDTISNFSQLSYNSDQSNQFNEILSENAETSQQDKSILSNKCLQSSSSENNHEGKGLRENVDSEQRRSAQKSFTGKDQKNISPYSEKRQSSARKYNLNYLDINAKKAKRQISFDN